MVIYIDQIHNLVKKILWNYAIDNNNSDKTYYSPLNNAVERVLIN